MYARARVCVCVCARARASVCARVSKQGWGNHVEPAQRIMLTSISTADCGKRRCRQRSADKIVKGGGEQRSVTHHVTQRFFIFCLEQPRCRCE
jgi:hypothetical protein